MTWTAPDVVREPGPWTGGERALLEWFLDFYGHADLIRERLDGATRQ
jgi:hypothetical protein